ncbi:hypothetical protein HGA89_02565 [bacterium]|nr:hypothetical protein [bacterium]
MHGRDALQGGEEILVLGGGGGAARGRHRVEVVQGVEEGGVAGAQVLGHMLRHAAAGRLALKHAGGVGARCGRLRRGHNVGVAHLHGLDPAQPGRPQRLRVRADQRQLHPAARDQGAQLIELGLLLESRHTIRHQQLHPAHARLANLPQQRVGGVARQR